MRWVRDTPLRIRVMALAGFMLALLLAQGVGALLLRTQVNHADQQLTDLWQPVQLAAGTYATACVDQETGVRGYLITGQSEFLEPYRHGEASARAASDELNRLLAGRPDLLARLSAAKDALTAWQRDAAEPMIELRAAGRRDAALALSANGIGKQRFDVLRVKYGELGAAIAGAAAADLAAIREAQTRSTWILAVTTVLAVLLGVLTVIGLRRALVGPLRRLVGRVTEVADGNLTWPVPADGPPEIAMVGGAVERMRTRILDNAETAARTHARLSVLEEHDRIARDLHDNVIQRLFAIGMGLQAMSAREPQLAERLAPVVEGIDGTIEQARAAIFGLTTPDRAQTGLRQQVLALTGEAERTLGFAPTVRFDGPIEGGVSDRVAAEVVPALREALDNVGRHAHASRVDVEVLLRSGTLQLRVVDDGAGGDWVDHLPDRAQRLGGTCDVHPAPDGGTVVDWRVPAHEAVPARVAAAPLV